MTMPSPAACLRALEATWPPVAQTVKDGWVLRDAGGGGKRVAAATQAVAGADPAPAEAAMWARGEPALFRLGPGDGALCDTLLARGYRVVDPTLILAAPVGDLAEKPAAVTLFDIWPPLAIMRDIWADGGIGPARIAVMDRACSPHTGFVARIQDRVAGAAFCAVAGDIAMLHAVEVAGPFRRKGVARTILRGAAHWAQGQGAAWLSLAVTEANAPARALYEGAGMQPVTTYFYMQKDIDHD